MSEPRYLNGDDYALGLDDPEPEVDEDHDVMEDR